MKDEQHDQNQNEPGPQRPERPERWACGHWHCEGCHERLMEISEAQLDEIMVQAVRDGATPVIVCFDCRMAIMLADRVIRKIEAQAKAELN